MLRDRSQRPRLNRMEIVPSQAGLSLARTITTFDRSCRKTHHRQGSLAYARLSVLRVRSVGSDLEARRPPTVTISGGQFSIAPYVAVGNIEAERSDDVVGVTLFVTEPE